MRRRAGVRKPPENNVANEVTLCSKCGYQNDEAEKLLWM